MHLEQMEVILRRATEACRPISFVFQGLREIRFQWYLDSIGADDTELCQRINMFYTVCRCVHSL